MTIRTEADEHDGPQKFTNVKMPGRELLLQVHSIDGIPLGHITLSRVESRDATLFTVEAASRGKAIKEWLIIQGLSDDDIPTGKKRGTRTFERATADFTISPRGKAVYFFDAESNRQYRNLRVMLQPSEA